MFESPDPHHSEGEQISDLGAALPGKTFPYSSIPDVPSPTPQLSTRGCTIGTHESRGGGTIVMTTLSESRIAGTIEFEAVAVREETDATVTVTDCVFDISF